MYVGVIKNLILKKKRRLAGTSSCRATEKISSKDCADTWFSQKSYTTRWACVTEYLTYLSFSGFIWAFRDGSGPNKWKFDHVGPISKHLVIITRIISMTKFFTRWSNCSIVCWLNFQNSIFILFFHKWTYASFRNWLLQITFLSC